AAAQADLPSTEALPSAPIPFDLPPPAQTPSAQTPCDAPPPARMPDERSAARLLPNEYPSTCPSPGAGRRAAAGEAFCGKPGEIMPSVAWPLSPQRVPEVAAGRPP
ncbi:MAG TPA: hypothetical protein VMB34_14155, partial [Acetobacteraceae bacterium]|nr:hypothetical protein [Acetobacteraceae bacterium]